MKHSEIHSYPNIVTENMKTKNVFSEYHKRKIHGCKSKIPENLKILNLVLFQSVLYKKRELSGVEKNLNIRQLSENLYPWKTS
jgi:hypothetical protein